MKNYAKVLALALVITVLAAVCVLFGCTSSSDGNGTESLSDSTTAVSDTEGKTDAPTGTDGTTAGTTTAEGTTAGTTSEGTTAEGTTAGQTATETTTAGETTAKTTTKAVTTEKPVEPVVFDAETPTLNTKNSTLSLSIGNDAVTVESLKTTGGFEYVTSPVKLSLPNVGEKFAKKSVKEYKGERTSKGVVVTFESSSFTYDQYIVSSANFSGPFEFYGMLTNKTSGNKTVSNGSYFDFTAKFDTIPTATTFRKESGVAEGWKIYSGTYYSGSGIYTTKLGKTGTGTAANGKSARFDTADRAALYLWTDQREKEEMTVSFYVKGTAGDKIAYAIEAAHATIDGKWQPAVNYDCSDSYTIKSTDTWEKVSFKFTPSNRAGIDGSGKVWNEDHANRGYPLFFYTSTSIANNAVWMDDLTVNGIKQDFEGSDASDNWPYGSWMPNGNVNLDSSNGYASSSDGTAGYATAAASYTTNQDWNAGGDISMMYLDTGNHGLYVGQEWTNGKIKAQGATGNRAVLNVMLGTGSFKTTLSSKQSMLFPSVYLGVYDGDIETGSNLYKRWFLNEKAPANMISNKNEPLTQQDMQLGTGVTSFGIQSIKWDYGWWTDSKNGSWKNQEGLLELGCTDYKNATGQRTIAQFTDSMKNLKANGQPLTLATYVLLKDTKLDRAGVPTSVGKNGHPEWFSNRIVTVCPSADLGNVDCVKFYQKYMYDFFKPTSMGGQGVTTWRSDFEPICRSSDKANRHAANGTDVQYWCTVGFGELVDYLIDNIDGFRYESCCSGGAMKDLFTMTKASVINCDDSADYMSLHMSFYDSSYAVHPAQLQLPINSLSYCKGSPNYTGCADQMYGLRCQITGGVMLSNWQGTNAVWRNSGITETVAWKTTIAVDYNTKIKPLIREGDLYHILPRPDGKNWDGLEYVNINAAKKDYCACVMLWKPTGAGNTQTVKLRGLDPNATYSLEFTDHTKLNTKLKGKVLMETGLSVTFAEAVSSDIIYLKKV